MYKEKKPTKELIRVKNDGLHFHDQTFHSLREVISYFKENLKEKRYQSYARNTALRKWNKSDQWFLSYVFKIKDLSNCQNSRLYNVLKLYFLSFLIVKCLYNIYSLNSMFLIQEMSLKQMSWFQKKTFGFDFITKLS